MLIAIGFRHIDDVITRFCSNILIHVKEKQYIKIRNNVVLILSIKIKKHVLKLKAIILCQTFCDRPIYVFKLVTCYNYNNKLVIIIGTSDPISRKE